MVTKRNGDTEKAVRELLEVAVVLINKNGVKIDMLDNHGRKLMQYDGNGVSMIYTSPFNEVKLLPGEIANYGFDIRVDGKGKVLSAWWEPLDIVTFKRGEWEEKLKNLALSV